MNLQCMEKDRGDIKSALTETAEVGAHTLKPQEQSPQQNICRKILANRQPL